VVEVFHLADEGDEALRDGGGSAVYRNSVHTHLKDDSGPDCKTKRAYKRTATSFTGLPDAIRKPPPVRLKS
jgi:hypothetical protein